MSKSALFALFRNACKKRDLQGAAAVALLCSAFPPALVHAGNATWTASSNGAWDTGSNWSTGSAASGSSSTATFGSATGTTININTAVSIGTLKFNSGAPAYSIAVNSGGSLALGASGIVNNSSNPLSITVNANARVDFNGTSTAGNSILFLNSKGVLDFSNSTGTITAGSLAGSTSTNVYLGSRTLTVGSLNSDTTFRGIISDGGNSGLTGGSLTKVGTGTLILDRDNTYTGTTTISAGTLQIGTNSSTGSILGNVVDNASLVFNRSGSYTFAGTISGSGTLTNSGSGTVTLSGTNSYSGGTLFNAGSLSAAADNNLGNSSATLTFNGGTLLYGAGFASARGVTLTGAGTFNTNSFSSTLSGVISGPGALTKSGSGTLILTGTNTYTGNTTVSAGTLQIGSGGTTGVINGSIAVSSGATLAFNRSNSMSYAGVLSGSGSVSKLGNNTLTLSGDNTYSGGTNVTGTLILTGANSGGGTATINSGATLQVGNGGTIGSIASAIANGGTLTFNRSDSLSYGGVISGSGTMTKLGAGTLTLSGANTFAGNTTVSAGTLLLTGANTGTGTTTVSSGTTLQVGNGSTGSLAGDVANSGVLAFGRTGSVTYGGAVSGTGSLVNLGTGTVILTGASTHTGGTTISAGTLQIGNGGTSGSISGGITDNAALAFNRSDDFGFAGAISGTGSLTKLGLNTLTLSGNNSYSGGTTVSDGILVLTGANTGTGGISISSTAGLQIGSGGTSGSIAGNVANAGSIVFNRSGTSTYGGVISGAGTLTKTGNGTLILTSANTYTGTTTISGGTLQIGNGGTTGSIAGSIVDNGVLAFNRSDDFTFGGDITGSGSLVKDGAGTLTLTGTINYAGTTTILGGALFVGTGGTTGTLIGDLLINTSLTFNRSDDYLYGNVISGTGSLTKLGAGTLTFTGENLYTGGTTISQGALQLGNGGTTGSIVGNVLDNSSLIFNHSNDISFGGAISGTGTVTKLGAGTLTLSGANTYSGNTMVSAGTLVLTGANTGGGTTTVNSGATLQVGNGGTTGSIAGNIVDNGVLTFNRSDDFTIGGNISGTGSLVKMGAGTLTLTGTVSYSGTTTILGGALFVGSGGTTGTLNGDLLINTSLTFNRSDDYLYGNVISGTGSLTKMGAGTLTFTGENLYTGGTTITQGALQLGNGGTTGSVTGDITDNSSLIFNHSNDITFGGVISGTGTLTKLGAGTLTLSGANTYSGGTFINAGTIAFTADNNLGDAAGGVTLNGGTLRFLSSPTLARAISLGSAGGTFDIPSAAPTIAGVISGSGSLTKTGDGYLFLTGANTYTGGTVVSGGGRLIGNSTSLQGPILNNSYLQFNQVAAGTYAGAISGTGEFYKQGGQLTLTGANTYTGLTTLGGGTLEVSGGGSINGTSGVTTAITSFAVATLNVTGASSSITTGGSVVSGNLGKGTLNITSGGVVNDANGVIGSASTAIGTATVSDAGSLWHNTGTLTVGSSGSGTLFVKNGGALDASSILLGSLSGSSGTLYIGQNTGPAASAGTINAATITTGAGAGVVNFAHIDSAYTLASQLTGSLSVIQSGSGTTILTGANTYTGGTTVSAGKLVGNTTSLQGAITNNGTLQFDQSGTGTYAGNVTGSGDFLKTGGQLTLTGTHTYTGATSIAGILEVSGSGTINGTSGITLASTAPANATLNINGTLASVRSTGAVSVGQLGTGTLNVTGGSVLTAASGTLGTAAGSNGTATVSGSGSLWSNTGALTVGASGTGVLTVRNGGVVSASTIRLGDLAGSWGTLNVGSGAASGALNTASITGGAGATSLVNFNHSDSSYTVAAQLGGNLAVNQVGSGTTILTATNTYTGLTTISGGTLQIGNGGTTGSITGDILDNGVLAFNRSDDFTFAGNISGTGSLIKMGAGILTLTGSLTYTGTTTILGGQLLIGTGGNTGNWDADINTNSSVTFNRSDDLVYGHIVSGTGSVVKQGSGTLTFTGANTYTGGTTITAGTLQIGNGGTTGSLVGDIVDNSNLAFNRSDNVSFGGVISGSGTLTKLGAGTLTLNGANTYSGGTIINAGTLSIAADNNLGATAGGITFNGGTLQLASGISTARAVTLNAGGTIDTGVGTATFSGAISGTGSLIKTGSGTLVLSGSNTYSGGTTVAAGQLYGSTQSIQGNVVDNGSVQFAQSSAGTYAGAITGTGSLIKQGSKLTVTGNNTYTGATTVTGELEVIGGGKIEGTSSITLGQSAFQNGSMHVTGTGSKVTTTGDITVGSFGLGTLTVDSGAVVKASRVVLGAATGSSGQLYIGTGGAAGAVNASTIIDGAGTNCIVYLNHTDSAYTLAAVLANSLSVNATGSGTTTLTGNNNYTGGTVLTAGTLRISKNENLGSNAGALTFDGGKLQIIASVNNMARSIVLNPAGGTIDTGALSLAISGNVSGAGGLTKIGTGTLSLDGTSTYTGGTKVNLGTLNGTTNSLKGTIRLNEANNPGLATVTFAQSFDGTFSGTVMGFGNLTKAGIGNVTLSGANTFVGETHVDEGTLTVNGSLVSPVFVGLGATLGGTGTIGGPVTIDGTLAPGAAPNATSGMLTVNGTLQFHGGSVFQVGVDDAGHNTRVNVGNSGTAIIDSGSVVAVHALHSDNYAASSTYTILNAQGGVNGTFDSVSSDQPFLDATLSYDSNNVYLNMTRNGVPFTARATTSNEVATASYLETLTQDSGATRLLSQVTQLTNSQAGNSFRELGGEALTNTAAASMRGTESVMQLLAGRLISGNTGQGTGLAFSRLVSDTRQTSARSGLWAGSFSSGGGMNGDGNAAGYEWRGNGAALGLDAAISEATLVGVSASYTHDIVESAERLTPASQIRSPRLMLYLQHDMDSVQLRGITGCANHAYTSKRRVTVSESTSFLNGQHDATECSAYAEAELHAIAAIPNLRPILSLNYSHLDEHRYTETGGLAALAVESHSTATLASNAGLRYSRQFDSDRGMFEARAIWTHEYGDVEPTLRASLAGAEERGTFAVRGASRARDSAVLGAGFAGSVGRNTLFHIDYNLELGQGTGTQHAFVAGFRYVH